MIDCIHGYTECENEGHCANTEGCLEQEDRCGAYAECWEEIGKPKGWLGCSLPKGHEGVHKDE